MLQVFVMLFLADALLKHPMSDDSFVSAKHYTNQNCFGYLQDSVYCKELHQSHFWL